jgi:hypothetical protein
MAGLRTDRKARLEDPSPVGRTSKHAFSPVTDAALARARNDPTFREKLLQQSLEMLLTGLQKVRSTASTDSDTKQVREGVELAVRLAEMIQTERPRGNP